MSSEAIIRPKINVETKVSLYDQTNATLVALLIMLGSIVMFLFLIWFMTVVRVDHTAPTIMIGAHPAGDEKPEGVADDIMEPGVEEFPEVETPQLADALEAVRNAFSSVWANSEFRPGDAAQMGKGNRLGSRNGVNSTKGEDIVPEYKRWKIEYSATDIKKYANQLSFFSVDLGAVNRINNEITRMSDPGGAGQLTESDRAKEKKSVYFAHERVLLQKWDETLFNRKGVNTKNCFTVQFYPEETKKILRQVELAYLAGVQRKLREVQNTYFKIVPVANGFEFQITKQVYRRR